MSMDLDRILRESRENECQNGMGRNPRPRIKADAEERRWYRNDRPDE